MGNTTIENLSQLSGEEKEAIRKFLAIILERFGNEIDSLCLFGSKCRKEADRESDIDILIIFKEIKDRRYVIHLLSEIESNINIEYGILISSYPMEKDYYEFHKDIPFIKNVINEGVLL